MPIHVDHDVVNSLNQMLGPDPEKPKKDKEDGGLWAGLVNLVKSAFAPSEEAQVLEQKVASPLVQDTLFPLIGGEPAGGIGLRKNPFVIVLDMLLRDQEIGGSANPITRGVGVNPKATMRGDDFLEELLSHELAHISDFRNEKSPLHEIQKNVAKRWEDMQAKEGPSIYAQTNEREHFAEAFRAGLGFIRMWNRVLDTIPDPERIDARRLVDEIDTTLPGTREVVMGLIEHPLYAESAIAQKLREGKKEGE